MHLTNGGGAQGELESNPEVRLPAESLALQLFTTLWCSYYIKQNK